MAKRLRPGGLIYMWQNFKNSLQRRADRRVKVGDDYLGNNYFEQQIRSLEDRSRVIRSFESRSKEEWDQVPPEWEAWLRNKRQDPPSREEIHANIQMMKQKQDNAKKLEARRQAEIAASEGGQKLEPVDPAAPVPFPKYDYENDGVDQAVRRHDGPPVRDHTIR